MKSTRGIRVKCKEDMEIINLNINFTEGHYYLAVAWDDGIYIVDENHVPVKIPDKQLKRHFEPS